MQNDVRVLCGRAEVSIEVMAIYKTELTASDMLGRTCLYTLQPVLYGMCWGGALSDAKTDTGRGGCDGPCMP